MTVNAKALVGPSATVRECIAYDTWLRNRPDGPGGLPWEAACHLCETPPRNPGEGEYDYNQRLREAGSYHGPDTKESCRAWVDRHLRRVHGLLGITGEYETHSGLERWPHGFEPG